MPLADGRIYAYAAAAVASGGSGAGELDRFRSRHGSAMGGWRCWVMPLTP